MKISQKGLYALQAITTLGRRYGTETIKIRDIAIESDLPEKFLELILLELKNARLVGKAFAERRADTVCAGRPRKSNSARSFVWWTAHSRPLAMPISSAAHRHHPTIARSTVLS